MKTLVVVDWVNGELVLEVTPLDAKKEETVEAVYKYVEKAWVVEADDKDKAIAAILLGIKAKKGEKVSVPKAPKAPVAKKVPTEPEE